MTDDPKIAPLLRQAQHGDPHSMNLLLAWLRQRIKPWAQHHLQARYLPHADATDVAQGVCIRIHRAFDRLYDDCAVPQLLAWTRKILNNVVADRGRRAPREVAAADFANLAADTSSAEQCVLRRERDALLEQAIERLLADERHH